MLAIARVWPRGIDEPGRSDGLVAGAACGVAFSTHYYCIFLVLPLTWAIVQRWRPMAMAHRGATSSSPPDSAAASYSSRFRPSCSSSPSRHGETSWPIAQIVIDRAVEAGAFGPATRYAEMLVDGLGRRRGRWRWRAALASGSCWWWRRRALMLLLAFPIAFFAFITNTAPASRYLNPHAAVRRSRCAAWTLAYLADWHPCHAARDSRRRWSSCCIPSLLASIRTGLVLPEAETRDAVAEQFIEAQLPAGLDHPGPALFGHAHAVARGPRRGPDAPPWHLARASTKFQTAAVAGSLSRSPAYRIALPRAWGARRGQDLRRSCGPPVGVGSAEAAGVTVRAF